jgi:hypothetical protein
MSSQQLHEGNDCNFQITNTNTNFNQRFTSAVGSASLNNKTKQEMNEISTNLHVQETQKLKFTDDTNTPALCHFVSAET